MNFKKVLSIASVASVAVVGLASCGKDKYNAGALSNLDKSTYTGKIVAAVNYNNLGYMTYGRGNTSKVNWVANYTTVDGRTLVEKETLTPIWQDIAANMNCTLVDGSPTGDNTETVMKNLITAGYKGLNKNNVQLLQITTGDSFTNAVDQGDFLNLNDYLDFMPNLKSWLKEHTVIQNQLTLFGGTTKEGIYYTPYFDGLDQQELAFNMNIDIVRALLDENPTNDKYDDNGSNKVNEYVHGAYDETAATNFVSDFKYTTPYIKSMDSDIAIGSEKGAKIHVTIKEGQDIITRMSNLTTKNGKTLVECFKQYIDDVYGEYIGEGKTYKNRSELFTSVASAYNADELIALLRCVKANPAYLTGNAQAEMTPFFPRTGERNRVTAYYDIAQIWGLRGTGRGEYEKTWLNSEGKVVDGKTQDYNLYCLNLCRQLQEEKLFATTTNWYQDGTKASSDWRQNVMTQGTAFMCYDYTNVAAYNSDKNQGISPSEGAEKRNVCANMQAVLSPYAKWAFNTTDGTLTTDTTKQIVGADSSNKFSYTRFTEDDRSLKNGGWSIVKKNISNEEQLKKCLEIMDYLYSAEGSVLECFGYNDKASDTTKALGWKKGSDGKYIQQDEDGNYYVNLSDNFKKEQVARTAGTWHNYMTMFWGSCLGVGNIRSNYLESQLTGQKQQVGTEKLGAAMGNGALYLAKTSGKNFLSVVPTTCSLGQTESDSITTNCKDLTKFWSADKAGDGGWSSQYLTVIYGGWSSNTSGLTSASAVKAKFEASNSTYLRYVSAAWNKNYDSADQYAFLGLDYKLS